MTTAAVSGPPSAIEVLKLLADDTRWRILTRLRQSDHQVGELVAALSLPQNLVSYHLGVLREAGFVQAHRSEADARALYYALDLPAVQSGYQRVGMSLQLSAELGRTAIPPLTVLFVCTANSARSQIAEAWLRHLSGGRLMVRSAGTAPAVVHPLATAVMAEAGIDIGYQHAKGFDALGNLRPDIAVTVCDRAREQCAKQIEAPTLLHWSVPDPIPVKGTPPAQLAAFRLARDELHLRVRALLALLPSLSSPAS